MVGKLLCIIGSEIARAVLHLLPSISDTIIGTPNDFASSTVVLQPSKRKREAAIIYAATIPAFLYTLKLNLPATMYF